MSGADYAGAFKAAAICLLLAGCGFGWAFSWIAPALWQGITAFWRALWGGV